MMAAARKVIGRRIERRPPALQGNQSFTADSWYDILGIERPTNRVAVSDSTVRGLPAAGAAVAKISNAVGQMMSSALVLKSDGRTPMDTVPAIVDQPDVFLDPFPFWKSLADSAVMRGNWIGIKAGLEAGFPTQVIGVPFDAVNGFYDEDGYPWYEIAGHHYRPDEIVHVRCGYTPPGEIMTIGVIEAYRRGLAGMLAQQGMANSVFDAGAVPSGLVQVDVDAPTTAQATTVKSNWVGNLGGRRTVAVIGRKMTYTPINWSADDAQFIETQQFSVAMVALMFGLRPSDLDAAIGGAGASTYGNRSDDNLQRITDAYMPVMLPIEQAWSRLVPGRAFVRGNVEALLRSTTKERYEVHKLAQEIGVEVVDETRDIEGKPPLPPGDKPPPAPPAGDDQPDNSDEETQPE